MFKRNLQIDLPKNRTAFLWGPRKVGKSTFLKQNFKDAFYLDLLDFELQNRLAKNPSLLREMLAPLPPDKLVIIDEVQKIPTLLDEVHKLIEDKSFHFILSGSSARKLKQGQANLLGGRAWRYEMHPLVSVEIGEPFDLDRALYAGLFPAHYLAENPYMDLRGYALDYLKEEIQAEALTRNLPAFSRFLEAAALSQGCLINYANIARDSGVSGKTVREYYQILIDTLLGFTLEPWTKHAKRRLIETEKFYFCDNGIINGLLNRKTVPPKTSEYGIAFETFIIQSCRAYNSYSQRNLPLFFWRTASGAEVDLIIGNAMEHSGVIAIEIKGTPRVQKITGLHLFSEEQKCLEKLLVSCDPIERKSEKGIWYLPWTVFMKRLFQGDFF